MECWNCGADMVWDNDYDYADIFGYGEGIVTYLHCSKCKAECEFSVRTDNEDDE